MTLAALTPLNHVFTYLPCRINKIGWLNVRRHPSDVYEPERVNGVAVPLPILDEFFARAHSEYRQSPEKVVRLIDAREGSEREAVRVISGSAYLAKLVRVLHTTSTPRVTGYGVRHGIAFLLLHGLLAA